MKAVILCATLLSTTVFLSACTSMPSTFDAERSGSTIPLVAEGGG